jgi:hypothetical protein
VSAVPPLGREYALTHDAIQYDTAVVEFLVGTVVGASVAGLLFIVIAPSRRVRAEKPLARDVEAKLLLGQDPDVPTIPPPPSPERPGQFTAHELAQLRNLGSSRRRR